MAERNHGHRLILCGVEPHEIANIRLVFMYKDGSFMGFGLIVMETKVLINLWHDNEHIYSIKCNLAFSFSNNKVFCLYKLLVRFLVFLPHPRHGGGGLGVFEQDPLSARNFTSPRVKSLFN